MATLIRTKHSLQQRWQTLVRRWVKPIGVAWNDLFGELPWEKRRRAHLDLEPLERRELFSYGISLYSNAAPDPLQGTSVSVGRANIGLLDGNTQLAIPISLYQSDTGSLFPSMTGSSPALVYNSDTVNVHPVVAVQITSGVGDAVPTSLVASFTFNGVNTVQTFTTTGHSAGDTYLLAVQDSSQITSTGYYSWSMQVTVNYTGGPTVLSTSGSMPIVVNDNSNYFGAGWSLDGMDSVVPVTGGVLLVYGGTGGARFFSGTSGTLTNPANDFGTMVNTGSGYTYTEYNQTKEYFDSNGRLTKIVDPHGLTLTYTLDGSNRLSTISAPDGAVTTFAYDVSGVLQTVQEVGSRTLTFTHSSGDQTSVTNPDGGVRTFTYSTHELTVEQWGNQTTTYTYSSGMLSSVNRGGSTTNIAPVLSQGLPTTPAVNASAGVAVVTDPLSHATTYALDSLGRTTKMTAADGGVYQYNLNSAGLVTVFTDPLSNVTTYTYGNSNADVTKIQNPDGGVETMTYQSTFHKVASDTDPLGHTMTYTYDGTTGDLLTVKDALGDVTTYTYSNGLLSTEKNASGLTTTYQYNAATRQVTDSVDALNNRTTYTYNGAGWVTQENQPFVGGGQPFGMSTFAYSGSGNTTSSENPLGNTITFSYDAFGHVIDETDPLGNRSTFSYDARGNLVGETKAVGSSVQRLETFTYNAADELIASSNGLGNVTSYSYDAVGRETGVEDALGNRTTMLYDLNGNKTTKIDALGNRTTYSYDSMGNQTVIQDALGDLTTTTHDLAGNVLSVKNALGVTTSYAYDALNRQTREIDDFGGSLQRTLTTTYDAVGNVLAKLDGLGHATTYSYDAINRVSTVTDALGNVTTYTYTANPGQGKLETDTNALGNSVTYTYNGAGEVTNIQKASGFKETFTYDANGNQLTDNVAGNTTTYGYDALNRQVTETNALNGVTTYVYDAADNRTVLIDPDGNRTTFAYNSDNQLTTQTDPLNHSTTYAYNAVGELTSTTDNDGRRDDFTYDANGNKLTEKWYDNTGTFLQTQTFTYDAIGEMLTAQSINGNSTFTYDHLGRVSTVNEPFGLTLTYSYDAADNRTSMQDSKGGLETFAYDAGNRLTQVQFTGQSATLSYDYTYDAIGEVKSLTRYSDLTGTTTVGYTDYGYDGRGNVSSIYHYSANGSTIQSFTYTWDNSNRLTHKVINGIGTDLSYDATNQLKNDGTNTYTYDANGNRTMSGYTTTANEVTNDGTWTYTYDNAGNLTQKSQGPSSTTWTYAYDNHNELVGATERGSVGGTLLDQITYTYDALGHFIEWQESSGSSTTEYGYDGDNAWVDMDGSNNLVTRRLYGLGADNPVVKISSAGVVVWYLLDYQNSVIGMVNSSGTSLGSVTYDGFGKVLTNTLGTNADAYMFQGARRDSSTGLDYHDARWYDPTTGRWTTRDPGGFPMGDVNLYRFVQNGPTNNTDPSGRDSPAALLNEIANNDAQIGSLQGFLRQDINYFNEDVGDLASFRPTSDRQMNAVVMQYLVGEVNTDAAGVITTQQFLMQDYALNAQLAASIYLMTGNLNEVVDRVDDLITESERQQSQLRGMIKSLQSLGQNQKNAQGPGGNNPCLALIEGLQDQLNFRIQFTEQVTAYILWEISSVNKP